jgi:hypothetical protein
MLRKIGAILTLLALVTCVSAKEYKGVATKIDQEKKTITVKVDDAEKTFVYTDTTDFLRPNGKPLAQSALTKIAASFGDNGPKVTIATEEKDGKEVLKDGNATATKITVAPVKKKS